MTYAVIAAGSLGGTLLLFSVAALIHTLITAGLAERNYGPLVLSVLWIYASIFGVLYAAFAL